MTLIRFDVIVEDSEMWFSERFASLKNACISEFATTGFQNGHQIQRHTWSDHSAQQWKRTHRYGQVRWIYFLRNWCQSWNLILPVLQKFVIHKFCQNITVLVTIGTEIILISEKFSYFLWKTKYCSFNFFWQYDIFSQILQGFCIYRHVGKSIA